DEAAASGTSGATVRERYRSGQAGSKARNAVEARRAAAAELSDAEKMAKLRLIKKSSVEYEAVLMDQMVKQMRPTPMSPTPGGEGFLDIAMRPFQDFLSQSGGLGLSGQLAAQVARQEGLEQTLQDYPGVMGPAYRPAIPPNLMAKTAGGLKIAPDEPKELEAEAAKNEEPAAKAAENAALVGLMDDEEIAYLYRDAAPEIPAEGE
ncbi:MAG: hypothetical protein LBS31_01630, partial [Candidatus Adiutrix sp.]|nr:hypothetical protein [Candidatus Adiutrix sp.]